MSAPRAIAVLAIAFLTACAGASLERTDAETALSPTIDFLELREGDSVRGRVRLSGCFEAGIWTIFSCTVEDGPPDRDRVWRFRIGRGEGSSEPPFETDVELVLDTVDVLDLDWELEYLRRDASGIRSTSTLEYWLEWWRDGEVLLEEHRIDDSGGCCLHRDALALPRLWEYAQGHPEELRTSAERAHLRRTFDRYGE